MTKSGRISLNITKSHRSSLWLEASLVYHASGTADRGARAPTEIMLNLKFDP